MTNFCIEFLATICEFLPFHNKKLKINYKKTK